MKWAPAIASFVVLLMSILFWATHYGSPKNETFDCAMLVGGWHPDVPQTVRDGCNSPNKMT